MELYFTVVFWIYLVGLIFRLATIAGSEYPREESKKSLGYDLVVFILSSSFFVWIIYLRYFVLGV